MNDPRTATRDRTGQTLGPYRVVRLLGAGGMGRVYLAEDPVHHRTVALKVLNDDVVRDGSARLRFLREAQAASAVRHPSVAAVYAIHEADDSVFIAMEYVEGRTLRSFLEAHRGPPSLREALRIARDVAHALCHAHAAGVVHRDLKPENLMLDLQGQVKILDFGLAKHAGPGAPDVEHASTLSFATADGIILGTPSYMAPEQIHGKATDARADIFSVGVILYEMATGARPFRGASTMEVLIATARDELTPASLQNPQVSPALDRVLARCLAKAPEHRFPAASELAAALDELLLAEVEVELHGAGEPGPGRGYLGEILPPRLLRGRDVESSALLAAVARAAEGGAHLILVHGESGVGKSALLSSLRDPITRFGARSELPDTSTTLADLPAVTLTDLPASALATPPPRPGSRSALAPPARTPPRPVARFISGKFDRNSEGAPLAPLAQALGALVRQAAASDMASRWRSDLSEATGPNRHVLDDMVPELRRLLGEPAPEAGAGAYHPDHDAEARNRFHAAFQRVIRLFAARHPPLVLALDDLHLADPAALELLEILLSDPAGGQLLVLASYRDSELGEAHPLVLTLGRLRRIGVAVDELALGPLLPDEATQLVADALGCGVDEAAPLAARLAPRARGNPALLRHLLLGLRRDDQLRFDGAAGRWRWDETETAAAIVSGDVASLIAARLERLRPGVQRVVAIAALAGRPVDLALLSAVDGRGPLATTEDLRDALREGLLVPSDAALHSLQRNPDPADPAEVERRTYQPPHDGILSAARAILSTETRAELHLQLGRHLLARHRDADDDLFAIVDHLDRGADLILDPDEHERLARLHLDASRRARNATAYAAAVRHARAGLDALAAALRLAPDAAGPVDTAALLRRYPAHVFQLEREWMHAEAMRGELASADARFDPLVKQASSELERAELYRLKAQLDTYHGRPHEAMAAGLAGIYRLGVEMLPRPEPDEIEAEFTAVQAALAALGPGGWRELEVLLHMPASEDPEHVAVTELLAVIAPAAMFADTRLAYHTFLRLVLRSLARGPTRSTAYGLAGLGLYLAGARRDSAGAYLCGELALRLRERPIHGWDTIQGARILHIVGGLITGWTQPFAVAEATLQQGYELGVRTGDFAAATYNTTTVVLVLVARRHSLDAVRSVAEQRLIEARPMLEVYGSSILRSAIRMCRCLAGDLPAPEPGPGGVARWLAEVFGRDLERDLSPLTLLYLHIYALVVLYHFGRHDELPALPAPAAERLGTLLTPMAVDYFFFHALHRCAALGPDGPPAYHAEIAADLAQLRGLADTCPANFGARATLVAAAHAMARGRDDEAEAGLKQAIRAARQHGEVGTEAIACELAGRLSLRLGDDIVGAMYLRAAIEAYQRFGADQVATRLSLRLT